VQVVLKLIQPYTRIRIPFVSQQLNIPEADVEQLLVSLILDNRINGHIDQVGTSSHVAQHDSCASSVLDPYAMVMGFASAMTPQIACRCN